MRGRNFRKGLQKSRRRAKDREAPKKGLPEILEYEIKISRGGKFKIRPGRQTS